MPAGSAGEVIDDPDVTLAVRQLIEPWTTSSNGRAEIVAVEGTADAAVAALGVTGARLARITPSLAMAWLAWAGASGGAHGRRRGAAIGRFGAWWTVAALADLADAWPVEPDEIGEAVAVAAVVLVGRRRATARLGTATRRGRSGRGLRLGDQRPRLGLTPTRTLSLRTRRAC